MRNIVAIVLEPRKDAKQVSIENKLESFQELVGGYIETVGLSGGRVLIVNEEGWYKNLLPNRIIDDLRSLRRPKTLLGTIIMVRTKDDEFASVHGDDMEWINAHSKRWELINE